MSSSTPLRRSPANGNPRGTIVVFGGRGETADVYERLADRLSFDGYEIAAFGDPGDDLAAVETAAREILDATPAGPRVAVASDSANARLVDAVAAGRLSTTGLILAGALSAPSAVSTDGAEEEFGVRSACPVHRSRLSREGVITLGALAASGEADILRPDAASRVTVPVLALHGGADRVSEVGGALAVYGALPDAQVFVVRGGLHDILNDLSHRSVAATIVQFVERLRTPETLVELSPVSTSRFAPTGELLPS